MTYGSVPVTVRNRAVFLDVDGTLLEIAESPDAVVVPSPLKELLVRLASQEAGALALVSGRSLLQLDALFAPHRFAAAGLHGLERRDAGGVTTHASTVSLTALPEFKHASTVARDFARSHPGLCFEDKGAALALHFRGAPELAGQVTTFLAGLVAALGPAFHLQPGKQVLELKPIGTSKRTAIEAFLREAPFMGRRPVFVGDDVTDEDGFMAVNAAEGDSIRVGSTVTTNARWRFDDVRDVIAWLTASLDQGRRS